MASAIPWVEAPGTASAKGEIAELMHLFSSTPCMQLACDTLVGELLSNTLQWSTDGVQGGVPRQKQVAPGWDLFVANSVRAILVTGSFFFRKDGDGARVAHPTETWHDDTGKSERGGESRSPPWTAVVAYPPNPPAYSPQLDSPVQRAAAYARQLNTHVSLFLQRDRHNSRPACWLSVSETLSNTTGKSKPWFRTVGNDYIDTFSEQLQGPSDYQELIADRSKVIQSLGSETVLRRRHGTESDMAPARDKVTGKAHAEHLVTDGYESRDTRSLVSMNDAKEHMKNLEFQILGILGVPASAIGKNQNSERLASSNQLVARSLKPFHVLIKQLRRQVGAALKVASQTPSGEHVVFSNVLSEYELDRVESVLTESALLTCYSHTFNIPVEWIDRTALKLRRQMAQVDPKGSESISEKEQTDKKRKRETQPPVGSKDPV